MLMGVWFASILFKYEYRMGYLFVLCGARDYMCFVL